MAASIIDITAAEQAPIRRSRMQTCRRDTTKARPCRRLYPSARQPHSLWSGLRRTRTWRFLVIRSQSFVLVDEQIFEAAQRLDTEVPQLRVRVTPEYHHNGFTPYHYIQTARAKLAHTCQFHGPYGRTCQVCTSSTRLIYASVRLSEMAWLEVLASLNMTVGSSTVLSAISSLRPLSLAVV